MYFKYKSFEILNTYCNLIFQVSAPPNIKDALKHCMTAKKLLRQVSAPAGQLLPQQGLDTKLVLDSKILPGSKEEKQ